MENQEIKRGIDFENRVGAAASQIGRAFLWWEGKRLNRWSFLWIGILFLINVIIIYPLFFKDVSSAYESSAFLSLLAQWVKVVFHLPARLFFGFLTVVSFSFMPVSFYLFIRKMVLRHEFTAVLATFILILPNPFFYNTPILVNALVHGDGAHVLVLSSFPLLLLYLQSFLLKGTPLVGFLVSLWIGMIAIISPFALFNLIIFGVILMVGEGFQGKLRLKLVRLFFLLVAGIALSFFWYYPHVLTKIIILSHVQSAWSQFQSVLPLAIPVIPVAGALSFLIFDRREKLKPIFISLSLFVCYLSLYSVSSDLNISGIFTADRYLPELVFCSSFFLSILLVLLIELSLRSVLPKIKGKFASFVLTALVTFSVVVVGFLTLRGVTIVHAYIVRGVVVDHYQVGIGNIAPVFDWRDPSSLIADFISVATLLLLLYFVRKYPSHKTAHFH